MSPGVRCFLRLPWPLARALLDLPAATQPIRVLPTTHVLNQPRSALIPRPSAVPPPRRARAPPDPLHREWAGTMLGPVGGGRGGWRPDWGDAASVHPPILATATVRDALSCSLLPAGSPSRKPACVCLCLSLPRAHASEHFSPAILRDLLLPLDSTDTPSTATPTRRNGLLTSAEKASLPSPTPCTDRLESQGALLSAPPARPLARAFLGLRAVPLSLRHRLEPRLELRDPPLERLMRCCSALHGSERRHSAQRPTRKRSRLLGNVRAKSPRLLSSTSTGAISSLSARYTTAEGRLKALGGAARSPLWRSTHVHAHVDVPPMWCTGKRVFHLFAERIWRCP
jgi:hypothetical protein